MRIHTQPKNKNSLLLSAIFRENLRSSKILFHKSVQCAVFQKNKKEGAHQRQVYTYSQANLSDKKRSWSHIWEELNQDFVDQSLNLSRNRTRTTTICGNILSFLKLYLGCTSSGSVFINRYRKSSLEQWGLICKTQRGRMGFLKRAFTLRRNCVNTFSSVKIITFYFLKLGGEATMFAFLGI